MTKSTAKNHKLPGKVLNWIRKYGLGVKKKSVNKSEIYHDHLNDSDDSKVVSINYSVCTLEPVNGLLLTKSANIG